MRLSSGLICLCGNHLFILSSNGYLSVILNDLDTVDKIIKELQLDQITNDFIPVIKELANKTPQIKSLKKRCHYWLATQDISSWIPTGYKIVLKKINLKKLPWLELYIYFNKEEITYDKFSYDDYFLKIIKHTKFLKFDEKTILRINKYMAALFDSDVLLVNFEGLMSVIFVVLIPKTIYFIIKFIEKIDLIFYFFLIFEVLFYYSF